MRFSVVIPCHNAGRWITGCLETVAGQKLAPFETIVVNDASTDDTVDKAEAGPVPVKVLHTNKRSCGGSRNVGIEAAEGEWIAFLDADDLWHPEHLSTAAEALDGGDDVAYLPCRYDEISAEPGAEAVKTEPNWPVDGIETGLTHRDFMRFYATRQFFVASGMVVSRQRLNEIDAFDESQVRRQDIEMFLRAIAHRTWSCSSKATTVYRKDTPGALSRNVPKREYFMLRAMLLNREAYEGPEIQRLIRKFAKRAVAASITDGDAEDRRRARELAWPHVSGGSRPVLAAGLACPPLFALANRLKRKLRGF